MTRSLLAAAAVFLPTVALAHARLDYPTPRSQSSAIKTPAPCGTDPKTAPTVFKPGELVTVTWVETIDHPGWYRIAFAPSNDTGFDSNVLADMIPNDAGIQNGSYVVALPSTPCEGCSLQLIQHMTDKVPPSNYYSCADIAIRAPDAGMTDAGSGANDAGSAMDAGPGMDAGSPSMDAGQSGGEDSGMTPGGGDDAGAPGTGSEGGNQEVIGGCSAAGAWAFAPLAVLALLFVNAARRRRSQARR